MLQHFTLSSGLRVATYSIPQMRSVFLGLSVKAGSIFDTPKTSGISHFMEHMLVQGIPSFPNVEALSDYIEGLAGTYSAATYSQSIRFTASVPSVHLKDILEIGCEVLYKPLFPEDAYEREKTSILEEIKERQDALWHKNGRFFTSVRFKEGHPLRLDAGGTVDTIRDLRLNDLKNYWSKFFFPRNTYLVLVGGFEDEDIKNILEDFFGNIKSDKKFPGFPSVTNKDLSDKTIAIRDDRVLRTCYLDVSFPSVSDDYPLAARVPQAIIRDILGGLRGSRLYRLLRQRKGLVYDVGVGSAVYQHFGYSYIYSQVTEQKLLEVVELIGKELLTFYQNGPIKEEVAFAKNYHTNRILMQWDHPSAIADWLSSDLMWEDKIHTPEDYAKLLEAVDVDTIKKFMQTHWNFDKLNMIIQGPLDDSDNNKKKIAECFGGF